MRISELIGILESAQLNEGDIDVYYLSGESSYEVKFLGVAESYDPSLGTFFWLTADSKLSRDLKSESEQFKAPAYRPILKIVK